ncbi:MAG: hypothetical protein ACRDRF_18870, partial [Pseudonocardiaceae bacterium]
MTTHWLQQWLQVLYSGVDEVAQVLTSRSPLALELRQNSPFAGALPQQTRSLVLAAFAKHWRDEHTAGHEGNSLCHRLNHAGMPSRLTPPGHSGEVAPGRSAPRQTDTPPAQQ